MDLSKMYKKVIKVNDKYGNHCVGMLSEIEEKFIKITFKNKDFCYINIDSIAFIAPLQYQPAGVE